MTSFICNCRRASEIVLLFEVRICEVSFFCFQPPSPRQWGVMSLVRVVSLVPVVCSAPGTRSRLFGWVAFSAESRLWRNPDGKTPAVPILRSFMACRTERPTHSPPPCWSLTPCCFGWFLLGLFLFRRAMNSSIRRSPALAPASVKTAWTCVSFTPTLTPSATSCTTSRTIPERSTISTTNTPR